LTPQCYLASYRYGPSSIRSRAAVDQATYSASPERPAGLLTTVAPSNGSADGSELLVGASIDSKADGLDALVGTSMGFSPSADLIVPSARDRLVSVTIRVSASNVLPVERDEMLSRFGRIVRGRRSRPASVSRSRIAMRPGLLVGLSQFSARIRWCS
jgi:hypothetical protein